MADTPLHVIFFAMTYAFFTPGMAMITPMLPLRHDFAIRHDITPWSPCRCHVADADYYVTLHYAAAFAITPCYYFHYAITPLITPLFSPRRRYILLLTLHFRHYFRFLQP